MRICQKCQRRSKNELIRNQVIQALRPEVLQLHVQLAHWAVLGEAFPLAMIAVKGELQTSTCFVLATSLSEGEESRTM